MGNKKEELVQYIYALLNQGYPENYIRGYLVQYYDIQTINLAFLDVHKLVAKNYFRTYLQSGYPYDQIKNELSRYYLDYEIAAGYQEYLSENQTTVVHEFKISNRVFAITLILLLIVGFASFGVYKIVYPYNIPKLLDIKITQKDYDFYPGKKLEYKVDLISEGSKVKYDVTLTNQLVDFTNGKILDINSETFAIYTSEERTGWVEIPSDIEPGRYKIISTVSYDDERRTSSFLITIKNNKTIDQEPVVETTTNITTNKENIDDIDNILSNYTRRDDLVNLTPVLINQSIPEEIENSNYSIYQYINRSFDFMTYSEQYQIIIDESAGDINSMMSLCTITKNKDRCIKDVTLSSNISGFCELISDPGTKDSCYYNFAKLKNDRDSCGKIQAEPIRNNCISIMEVNDLVEKVKKMKEEINP